MANNPTATTAPAAQEPTNKEWGELRPPVRDTDFKEKYPPDRELGHELDDTARVWKVCRGEAIDHDDALLKTWNETVSILLTFAGLFSAAVTSFVVASTDDLKPDPNAYVANLLFAMGNATGSASPFAHFPAPPPLEAAPTSLARIVNGLWFTSLFLSLAAALLCILVKQWLDEYTARTRGSAKHPHEWAQRRSFYFQGLHDWNIAAIISFLPLFLHLALFLFLAGLTAFLWDLDSAIRWVMLILFLSLLAFYLVSLFIPVWSAACPYATPLLVQLRNVGYAALISLCLLAKRAVEWRISIYRLIHHTSFLNELQIPWGAEHAISRLSSHTTQLREQMHRRPFERVLRKVANTALNYTTLTRNKGDLAARLDCSALEWLMRDVSDSDAVAVAWQSLGAFLENSDPHRLTCMLAVLPGLMKDIGGNRALWRTLRTDGVLDDMQLGRIGRSALFIACSDSSVLFNVAVPSSDEGYVKDTRSPDAALVFAFASSSRPANRVVQVTHRLHEQRGPHPLVSTALWLLDRLGAVRIDALDSVSEAAIGLLHYCSLHHRAATAWTHVAHVLGHMCTGRHTDPLHACDAYCLVNALGERVLQLIKDENSPAWNTIHFDAYFHVQLMVRIVSSSPLYTSAQRLSVAAWTVLTDSRWLTRRQRRASTGTHELDWAPALYNLAASGDKSRYLSFAPQYYSMWCALLGGCTLTHSQPIHRDCICFDASESEGALGWLASALDRLSGWEVEIEDPQAIPTLQSRLKLAESASIAFCSVFRQSSLSGHGFNKFMDKIHPLALFPTNLSLTKGEYSEWIELFASAMQHLIVLDPGAWQELLHEVHTSSLDEVKRFFKEVHSRLMEIGPCSKGGCAGKEPECWLPAVGPMPRDGL